MDLGDKQVRKGPGVGCGVFDLRYVGDGAPIKRWGKNYLNRDEWTPEAQDLWEEELQKKASAARSKSECVRLFKVVWQGQELSRQDIVKVMAEVLEPVGEVDSLSDCKEDL